MLGEATLDVSGTFLGEAIREVNKLPRARSHRQIAVKQQKASRAGQSRLVVLMSFLGGDKDRMWSLVSTGGAAGSCPV